MWLFLQLVALFGISGLFVRENKTSQPVDLRIKLGAAAYSVEIPLNHNMKHFQINKPSLASGISIWGRRMREWVKIKFRLSLSRNQILAPHYPPAVQAWALNDDRSEQLECEARSEVHILIKLFTKCDILQISPRPYLVRHPRNLCQVRQSVYMADHC